MIPVFFNQKFPVQSWLLDDVLWGLFSFIDTHLQNLIFYKRLKQQLCQRRKLPLSGSKALQMHGKCLLKKRFPQKIKAVLCPSVLHVVKPELEVLRRAKKSVFIIPLPEEGGDLPLCDNY
jgi:hypothetical protein